uniref:Peptide N-acetyl-beta-D-glucosaminyl asparaginase amidase A N-terminal domain-containing protein n=1 Tax=Arundo donax TaxID=35708 RepID=A0A0A9QQ12_ARUDO
MSPADLIVPMSRSLPLNDGLWYQIQNATDVESTSVTLPSNAYRAVLEVYASFHGDDEFWYTNTPASNGPFREVTVRVDGVLAGAVWPFPVIYTGGINPLLWRPITAIGSFNLPTYDIELTPFLGKLLDGKAHEFGFAVTNALDMWYVDANLHLWLDRGSTVTTASLVSYDAPELAANTTSSQSGGPDDIMYHTTASRHISTTGWVKSSYGNITTNATQTFTFENTIAFNDDTSETVNQTTVAHACILAADYAGVLYSVQEHRNFPLYLDSQAQEQVIVRSSVTHGLDEATVAAGRWSGAGNRSLRNMQSSVVDVEERDGKAVGVSWGTRQTYRYEAADGCYFRNVSSRDYSVVSDQSNEVCVKAASAGGGTVTAALPAMAGADMAPELGRN